MENWKFAISSIMGHKMRALLTMLGIIIGVAAVVVIMGLGNAMKKSVIDGFSGDKREVQLYFQQEDSDENPYAAFFAQENNQPIKEEWLEEIRQAIPGIENYYFTNSAGGDLSYQKKTASGMMITGVSPSYFDVKKYDILAGRKLTLQDYQNFSRVIMIDTVLSEQLFSSHDEALNKVISLGSKDYLVIGVYKAASSGINAMGATGSALMTNTQVSAEFGVSEISSVYIYVKDATQSSDLGNQAAAMLTALSQVKGGKYTIADMSQFLGEVETQVGLMTAVVGAIAGISLLVGGIGVMNIMLVSVTERTREIGLRKALGATRGKVLTQFLIEAVVLTVIGGLIGLLLAVLACLAIASNTELKPVVAIDVAIISLIFSAFVGIVFGILPANKASKLDPIEALRYE